MKWIKDIFVEISALAWTLGGTAIVLITLSGSTREIGIWISILSLVLHMIGWLVDNVGEK